MAEAFIGEIRAVAFDYAPEGWLPCDGRIVPIAQYVHLFSVLGNKFGGDPTSNFGLPDLRGRAPIGFGRGNYSGASNYNLGEKGGIEQVTLSPKETPLVPHGHNATFTDPEFVVTNTDPDFAISYTDPSIDAKISGTVTPKAKTGFGQLTNSPLNAVNGPSGTSSLYSTDPNAKMAPAEVALNVDIEITSPGKVELIKKSSGNVTIAKRSSGKVSIDANPYVPPIQHENRMPFQTLNFIICYQGLYPVRP